MSSTIRIFHNDNRISTAVPTKSGILQVYPTKRQFASDVEWKQFWENELKPKLVMRFGESETKAVPVPAPAPVAAPRPSRSKKTIPASEMIFNTLAKLPPAPLKAKLSDWNVTKATKINTSLPAGTYYIGDLCYVLGDNIYDNIFGGTGYEMGIYTENSTGRTFVVNSTAWGDGEYPASDGKKFAVDAGIIGICPASLMAKDDGGGHMYTFDAPVRCKFSGGRFFFSWGYNSLVIDTTGDDDAY